MLICAPVAMKSHDDYKLLVYKMLHAISTVPIWCLSKRGSVGDANAGPVDKWVSYLPTAALLASENTDSAELIISIVQHESSFHTSVSY